MVEHWAGGRLEPIWEANVLFWDVVKGLVCIDHV